MILVSSHLLPLELGFDLNGVTVRVNMAYTETYTELVKAVNVRYDVLIDYPVGRKKPPTVALPPEQAFRAMKQFKNIKYLAVSNVESAQDVLYWFEHIPSRVSLVPKIESKRGVENVLEGLKGLSIKYAMLDTEDLYTDVGGDRELYLALKTKVEKDCKEIGIHLLQLQGVVFA